MSNKLQNVLDEIKLEKDTYLLPENIKKDVQIFDVVGTLEGASTDVPVKLFETEEEMQADETAEEGDLAIVYRSEIQNYDGTSAITSFTFPKTVILSEAATGTCYGYASGDTYLEIQGDITSTGANFSLMGEDYYNITYTSEDGLTYTRTDSYDETITVSEEEVTIQMYEFSEVCGYFMRISGNTFEGLYTYKTDYTESDIYKNANYLEDEANYYDINEKISELSTNIGGGREFVIPNEVIKHNDHYDVVSGTMYSSNYAEYRIIKQPSRTLLCFGLLGLDSKADSDIILTKTVFDLSQDDIVISKTDVTKAEFINYPYVFTLSNSSADWYSDTTLTNEIIVNIDLNLYVTTITTDEAKPSGSITGEMVTYNVEHLVHNVYILAPTQFTLTNGNQLLPDKIAYGKNGIVTGNSDVWKQITDEEFTTTYLGIDKTNLKKIGNLTDNTAVLSFEPIIPFIYSVKSTNETTDYDIPLSTRSSISLGNSYSASYITKIDGRYFILYYNSSKLGIREWTLDDEGNITEGDWVYSDTLTGYDTSRVIYKVYDHNLYIAFTSSGSNTIGILKYDVSAGTISLDYTVTVSTTGAGPILIDMDVPTTTVWFIDGKAGPIKSCEYTAGTVTTLTDDVDAQYGFYEHFVNTGDNYWMVVDSSNAYIMNKHTGELKTKSVDIDTYYGSTYTYYAQSMFEDKGLIYTIAQKGIIRYNPTTDTLEVVAKSRSSSDGGRSYFNYFRLSEDSKYLYYMTHAQFTTSTGANNSSNIYRLDTETLEVKRVVLADTNTISNACIIPELDENFCVNSDTFNIISGSVKFNTRITSVNSMSNGVYPVIALSTGLYTTDNNVNNIFNSTLYENTITPEEYTEALNTVDEILGEEV